MFCTRAFRKVLLPAVFVVLALGIAGAQCTLDQTDPSVTICQPADGSTNTSPVHFVAGSHSSSTVDLMQIYVDHTKTYEVKASSIDTDLAMTDGSHRVTVQGHNSAGSWFNKTINITVGSSSTPPPCSPSTDPGVAICEPTNGATVDSPVHVVATSQSSNSAVTVMQIYVDGAKKYEVKSGSIDTTLSLASGGHKLTVQGINAANQVFKQSINITVGSGGGGGGGGGGTTGLDNLKHILFFVQENRSFDQYFGRFGAYRQSHGFTDPFDSLPLSASLPDYDGGKNVSPYHYQTVCVENLSPGWNESHYDYHSGAMDYFMKTSHSVPSSIDPEGTRAMGYYDQTELNYYYALALAYATSDRWFSPVMATTIPNRMYLFTGTSFGHIRPDSAPSGGWTQPTIFRKLQDAGISWKYYYQDNSVFLAQFSDWSALSGHIVSISNYYTDLTNGTLPAVVFIERASKSGLDEHPGGANLEKGAANTKKIIDALMHSSAWGSSAFILTFDEGGGLYDHVKPQPAVKPDSIAPMLRSTDIKADFDQTGFRVPVVVVSPWVKPHFVSHTVRDLTAILKLIETRFGLSALTARDAAQDDMTEFFDFNSAPHLTLPSLPAQNVSSTCSTSKEKAPGF